ncbi:MAG: hypothetical protein KC776_17110, partial [Myxococcales bacterium]|nr:hypothetical protein [Myxococcales bacterium]
MSGRSDAGGWRPGARSVKFRAPFREEESRVAEIKGVTPHEVVEMLKDGYVYVDVRSQPEFEAGHVPGSLNVPLLHMGPA